MVDTILAHGSVLTMNTERDVIEDGGVAITDGRIVDVGPTAEILDAHDPQRTIDAEGMAVLPGFVDAHTHISSIVLRGGNTTDKPLYDWLFNLTKPARAQMTPREHRVASALFCREAIGNGITTVVESAVGGGSGYTDDIVDAKMGVYESAGLRHMFAQSFIDEEMETELREYVDRLMATEPSVEAPPSPLVDTETALQNAEQLMERYHGTRDGRQEVWSGPLSPRSTTVDGLVGAYQLAEEYDAMTTTHVSETSHEEAAVGGSHQSMVEYLDTVGYLGDRALLAHCVHVNDRDIRLLAETDTKVSHNISANLALGAGVAPIYELRTHDVTVGLGTDNATTSDAIDILGDARMALFAQRGTHRDPTIMEPMDVLEMATIDGAKAIGRADEIGSIESGKRADITLISLDTPAAVPRYDLHSAVVLQLYRQSADTVLCNGEVILDSGTAPELDEEFDDLHAAATEVSEDIIRRTGVVEVFDGIA
jgi:cytosine/adenosine deaminase-related metal-dependent hydrolase